MRFWIHLENPLGQGGHYRECDSLEAAGRLVAHYMLDPRYAVNSIVNVTENGGMFKKITEIAKTEQGARPNTSMFPHPLRDALFAAIEGPAREWDAGREKGRALRAAHKHVKRCKAAVVDAVMFQPQCLGDHVTLARDALWSAQAALEALGPPTKAPHVRKRMDGEPRPDHRCRDCGHYDAPAVRCNRHAFSPMPADHETCQNFKLPA